MKNYSEQEIPTALQPRLKGTRNKAPERFHFKSADGLSVACVRWNCDPPIRGVLQIAHGLGEHIGRYAELAETLVKAGFVVYGNDHRGHGLTAKPSGSFGDFGPGGFDDLAKNGTKKDKKVAPCLDVFPLQVRSH
jgi:predicted alpha/beta hydrolase